MADFRETLTVTRNSTCFMSYSFCWVKEDLAELDEDGLQSPPAEIDWDDNATIGEITDQIERFCDKENKVFAALQELRSTGHITLTDEY